MAGTSDKPSEEFPQTYGEYQLLRRLGDGGMAEVFLAQRVREDGFQKTVVIKRILPHLARKKRFKEMFRAEASLAAQIAHQNVVQVFDYGRAGEELFMVMEYVEGTDLRVLLGEAAKRKLRIPPWFTIHVVCEILEALNYAWNLEDEQGRPRQIVHRDVTPSNIFISRHGQVKLGDFGVARDHTRESQTRAGQLKGKLAYMAPEQLYSKPPDHRVDVFACGVVLWEALAQRRLFGGRPEIEVMQAIAQGPRRPPTDFVDDLPLGLDTIVLGALEIDREGRTDSAEMMQEQLLEVLPRLRPRVRASDVQAVVAALTGEGNMRLPPLTRPQAPRTSRSTMTGASFSRGGSGGTSDPSGTPNLISDLTLGRPSQSTRELPPRGRSGIPRAPMQTPAPPIIRGTGDIPVARSSSADLDPVPKSGGSSDVPRSTPAVPRSGTLVPRSSPSTPRSAGPRGTSEISRLVRGRPLPRASSGADHVGGSGTWSALGRDHSALEGLMSPTGTGSVGDELDDDPLDMDALVNDAVASVVASEPESNPVPKDNYLAGLEHRRILDNSRNLSSERWAFVLDQELYDGPHPFWIRDHEGTELGPLSLEQALQVVKVEVKAGLGHQGAIACMRGDWLPMSSFLEMSGMESLTMATPPAVEGPAWSGSANDTSIGSVLVTLTRSAANGRLIVEGEVGAADRVRVVEVVGGAPTFVAAGDDSLQLPQLLVAKRLIHQRSMAPLLHGILARRAPLGRVLEEIAGIQIARYYGSLMKERLGALFADGFTQFTFDARHTPRSSDPFAKSLLAPMAELTFRFTPRERILRRVQPLLSTNLQPAQDYDRMLDRYAFKADQARVAAKLGRGRRIGKLLDGATVNEQRTVEGVAYVLLETELLRPE